MVTKKWLIAAMTCTFISVVFGSESQKNSTLNGVCWCQGVRFWDGVVLIVLLSGKRGINEGAFFG